MRSRSSSALNHIKISAIADDDDQSLGVPDGVNHIKISAIADVYSKLTQYMCGSLGDIFEL